MQDLLFIEKLKKRDEKTFQELVDSYQIRVINLAFGFLHDRQEAEDIAQEVFIEIYESIDRFRGESALQTWIYRITVNKSLNRKKRKSIVRFLSFSRGKEEEGGTHPEDTKSDPTAQPDYNLQQQEDQAALRKAIDLLPSQQKTAFLLSKYEELSYKEIAAVLKTSLSAVESLLFRAKKNLQKSLTSYINQ